MLQPDTPIAQRANETLDIDALNAFIKTHYPELQPITDVAQFPGGYSNLTYSVTLGDVHGVLRRPPVGAKNIARGHDVAREFKILTALQTAGFTKIPQPILLCADESILGAPFYIMQRVEGIILRVADTKKIGASVDAPTFKKLSETLCDTLAELHATDIFYTGLIAIGKPEGYITRQIDSWYKRYQAARTENISSLENVYAWLVAQKPEERETVLLHNDFKFDNVILNTQNIFQIDAILDWEMTTVGDYRMDVGTTLSYWTEATDDAFSKGFNITWLAGNITRAEFVARYAEKTGRDMRDIVYFYVFGLFKNAVVIQQIYKRFLTGTTNDARFADLIHGVYALLARAETAMLQNKL